MIDDKILALEAQNIIKGGMPTVATEIKSRVGFYHLLHDLDLLPPEEATERDAVLGVKEFVELLKDANFCIVDRVIFGELVNHWKTCNQQEYQS